MPFQKGRAKTGGNVKGSKHPKTIARLEILKVAAEDFVSKLKENRIDPLGHIAAVLPTLEPIEQAQVMLALLKYQYPSVKPISHKELSNMQNPFQGMNTPELLEQMRAATQALEEQVESERKAIAHGISREEILSGDTE